jgi:hypothetical protein
MGGTEPPAPTPYAARRRRAFCTVGSAALAFASGRARRSTLAGLAAIVISSPVAGFRPFRAFCAGFDLLARRGVPALPRLLRRLHANGQLHQAADPHLLRIPELLEHELLEHAEHPLSVCTADLGAVSYGARELCLGQRHGNSSVERCGRTRAY